MRPITIIIPFPPGGNSDIIVRALADRLSLALRQPVIVDNRPGGAGGTVGAKAVANANPDGYRQGSGPIRVPEAFLPLGDEVIE
jgi:tripartite-type tricarboxylate transporter receptor subunit TctC